MTIMLLPFSGETMADDVKQALRRRIRDVRRACTDEALREAGEAVARRVLALPEVGAADRILCYVSVRREVPTVGPVGLIEGLRAQGKQIAVPRVVGPGVMEARAWQDPLVAGARDIPTSDGPILASVALSICPGLAFDPQGGRLGYGGAYYDTWLAAARPFAVGVCLDAALVDEVPVEPHDVRMDVVITPTRTIRRDKPTVRVVAGAWEREGRLLAAQRRAPMRHAGLWELPGGKVEAGESDAAALRRELGEELGVEVSVGGFVGTSRHVYDDLVVEIAAYRVTADPAAVPRAVEHEALRWLARDEWNAVPWVPADLPLLDALAADGRG